MSESFIQKYGFTQDNEKNDEKKKILDAKVKKRKIKIKSLFKKPQPIKLVKPDRLKTVEEDSDSVDQMSATSSYKRREEKMKQ